MSFNFSPTDLRVYHVRSSHGDVPENLTVAIHPIFAPDHFRFGHERDEIRLLHEDQTKWDRENGRLSDIFYERLMPALRLATLMLERSMDFFCKVRYAPLSQHPEQKLHRNRRKLINVDILERDYTTSDAVRARFDAEILRGSIAESICFLFQTVGRKEGDIDPRIPGWLGLTTRTVVTGEEHNYLLVSLSNYYARCLSAPIFSSMTLEQRQTFYFHIANTLMHEFAHVVWNDRPLSETARRAGPPKNHPLDPWNVPEPIYAAEAPEVELGREWEEWFYGGKVAAIQREVGRISYSDPPGSTWTSFGDHDDPIRDMRGKLYALEMASVGRFFNQQAWDEHRLCMDVSSSSSSSSNRGQERGPEQRRSEVHPLLRLVLTPATSVVPFLASEGLNGRPEQHFNHWLSAEARGMDRVHEESDEHSDDSTDSLG